MNEQRSDINNSMETESLKTQQEMKKYTDNAINLFRKQLEVQQSELKSVIT